MIRRDSHGADGLPAWLLISQLDHARLAASLAEGWGGGDLLPLEPPDGVLEAIAHHDDGWKPYDDRPAVDAEDGRPLQFDELPLADTLDIWQRSIRAAADIGPLPGYLVAGHFCALLRRFDTWRKQETPRDMAEAFLAEYEALRDGWLADWQRATSGAAGDASRALQHLQAFDYLSLWLCCAARYAPLTLDLPGDVSMTFTPITPERFAVRPWPWQSRSREFEIGGHLVRSKPYQSADELADAESVRSMVHWTFTPDEA